MDKLYQKPRDVNLYGNAICPKSYGVYYKWTNIYKNKETLTIRANLKDSLEPKNHNVIFKDVAKTCVYFERKFKSLAHKCHEKVMSLTACFPALRGKQQ